MSGYEQDLIDLAREIAAGEGIPLAQALDRAAVELRGLALYAHDWDRAATEQKWALITVAQAA